MSEACAISPRVTMIPATRERFTSMPIHNARKRRHQNNKVNAEKEFNEWVSFAKRLLERAKAGEISAQEFQELIKK